MLERDEDIDIKKKLGHPYPCPRFLKVRSRIPDPHIGVHIGIIGSY